MTAIEQIDVHEALARQQRGARLVDVRERDEHALGFPRGAACVPRAQFEADPLATLAGHTGEVLLICGSGRRSQLAAEALAAGHIVAANVIGGFAAWRAAGLPVDGVADPDFSERYSRHLRLPQVGVDGQRKLEAARVLLVGAGGLGSPAAYYLAAAGVGRLRIVDDDVVDRSNLQRQILHTEAGIGSAKVESARQALRALNPRVHVEPVRARIVAANVMALLEGVDVVVDGADNFPTRYLLNDACVRAGKPLVYGAVHRFEGQASVFDAGRHPGESPCYRCLFPDPPTADEAPNCAEAGVLGVLPGVIGLLQATEAVKLILGLGTPLSGRLLQFDALAMRFHETRLRPDPDCPGCSPAGRARPLADIDAACASEISFSLRSDGNNLFKHHN
jgi:molybdopterin/thiamine biosynthesis adenylyltransferase/rhodanese-related sulfurtransferase